VKDQAARLWSMPGPFFSFLCLLAHRWRTNPDWPYVPGAWPWVCVRCWAQGRTYGELQ
jgi:hypothetical protein